MCKREREVCVVVYVWREWGVGGGGWGRRRREKGRGRKKERVSSLQSKMMCSYYLSVERPHE